MKIGLLGCDDVPQRLRHLGTYRDMFQNLLAPVVPDAHFVWYDAAKGDLPDSADACDAYICTGSRYSAYDEIEWIEALKRYVRRLHEAGKPFIGVCFGHQILAEALGGRVTKADQGWGVGIHEMRIVAQEDWMQPPQEDCKLQYMHADQVERLPPDSVVLASAPHCPVAMFRVGDTMLGIEGHPEFSAAYVEALVRARSESIGHARAQAALASLQQQADEKVMARWMASFMSGAPRRRERAAGESERPRAEAALPRA